MRQSVRENLFLAECIDGFNKKFVLGAAVQNQLRNGSRFSGDDDTVVLEGRYSSRFHSLIVCKRNSSEPTLHQGWPKQWHTSRIIRGSVTEGARSQSQSKLTCRFPFRFLTGIQTWYSSVSPGKHWDRTWEFPWNIFPNHYSHFTLSTGIAQPVQRLATGWATKGSEMDFR
jgi:hypothetical protein